MTELSRRRFLALTAAGAIAGTRAWSAPATGLRPLTAGVAPIAAQEYAARLLKLQDLMHGRGIAALLVESGSSLQYFTGVEWRRSERTTAAVIPAHGKTQMVTPYFEAPSVEETLRVAADIRTWREDESPFALIANILREIQGSGSLAVEPTTRYFIVEKVAHAQGMHRDVIDGDELVRACRMTKSPAELAIMQVANDVTLGALKYVHGHVSAGMGSADIENLMIAATEALGGVHEFSLVLLNEASAFPHGSLHRQTVRMGSTILIDSGCTVHGYQSDISRSWVFGPASKRQREVWDTVRRGQEVALQAARPGVPAGSIDRAVRDFYESRGWSKDYRLPGLSHRTGHGIGLDGHEPPYLVRSDSTPIEPGMCFSDEPGLYIPGEFGIRLEDCWHMSAAGPKLFTAFARSIDQPV